MGVNGMQGHGLAGLDGYGTKRYGRQGMECKGPERTGRNRQAWHVVDGAEVVRIGRTGTKRSEERWSGTNWPGRRGKGRRSREWQDRNAEVRTAMEG